MLNETKMHFLNISLRMFQNRTYIHIIYANDIENMSIFDCISKRMKTQQQTKIETKNGQLDTHTSNLYVHITRLVSIFYYYNILLYVLFGYFIFIVIIITVHLQFCFVCCVYCIPFLWFISTENYKTSNNWERFFVFYFHFLTKLFKSMLR